jgi:hypothetical protein
MKTIYNNFTEALKQLFNEGEIILEIGPGDYIYPTISILQNVQPRSYIAVDGARSLYDALDNFYQIGGIEEYTQKMKKFSDEISSNILAINSLAHQLPLKSNSIDKILFVKTLLKLTDGALTSWDKIKYSIIDKYEEMGIYYLKESDYKKLTILTYTFIVLEEARRVARKGIAIIPEASLIEENMIRNLQIYSEITGSKFLVLKVRRPTWTIIENGIEREVEHWQDNSSRNMIYIQTTNSAYLSRNEIIEYLKGTNSCDNISFIDLCRKLF